MRWFIAAAVLACLALVLVAPWSHGKGRTLNVIGSTSIHPFAEMLAQEYAKRHPGEPIDVQGGGSAQGLEAAKNHIAHIGMCSRELKDAEKAIFTPTVIARDGLAVVVHRSNPVEDLSLGQVHDMFEGKITSWKQVGGPDRPVRLITREEGSGTREAFAKLVMHEARISRKALTQESNGAVKELVRNDPCAIGYMSLGLVGEELKALKVDGAAPTAAAVKAKAYKLSRPFLFVTVGEPTPEAKKFIEFVLSPEAQEMMVREGLVSVK